MRRDIRRGLEQVRTCFLGGASILAVSACSYLQDSEELLAKNRAAVSSQFQQELRSQQSPQQYSSLKLNWNEALERMYMQNSTLLQADFKVEDAVAQKKKVFTDFIPLLSVGASDSFRLEDLDEAFDDVSYRVSSYLPLGQLVKLPKNVYKQKLLYMGSELQAENTMRQEVIALYRLFQKQHLLDLEGKAVQLESQLAQGLVGLEGADAVKLREDALKARKDWLQRKEEWRVQVGDFFMEDYADIKLLRQSLPAITYRASELDFTNTGRWGMLQMNLLALEKIAEDAKLLQVYLRYLPTPSFSVSAPSIYNQNTGFGFDADEIRLGPALRWSLDTRNAIGLQLNRIQREKPLSDWRKDKRRREEVKKLLEGRKALAEVQAALSKTEQVIAGYRALVKGGLVDDPEKAVRTMRKLREKQVTLAAKEIEICTSFWLIDETRWTAVTKRWKETRKIRAAKRKEDRKAAKEAAKARKKAEKARKKAERQRS